MGQGVERSGTDIPAGHRVESLGVRQLPAVRQHAGRELRVVEHRPRRAFADDLQAKLRDLRHRATEGRQEHVDPVPGLEAARETDCEHVRGDLRPSVEPVRVDRVRDHFDPGARDARGLQETRQRRGNGEDPIGPGKHLALDRRCEPGMRKLPEPE